MGEQQAQALMDRLEQNEELKQAIGEWAIFLAIALGLFLFRNIIEDWAKCVLWKLVARTTYQVDNVVIFDGEYGRLVRIGLFRTVLYLYHMDQKKDTIEVQTKILIFNSEMKEHRIEKPLDMLSIPKVIRQLTMTQARE